MELSKKMGRVGHSYLGILQYQPIPHFMSSSRSFDGGLIRWLNVVKYDGTGIHVSFVP
jgi:hypothetical protein